MRAAVSLMIGQAVVLTAACGERQTGAVVVLKVDPSLDPDLATKRINTLEFFVGVPATRRDPTRPEFERVRLWDPLLDDHGFEGTVGDLDGVTVWLDGAARLESAVTFAAVAQDGDPGRDGDRVARAVALGELRLPDDALVRYEVPLRAVADRATAEARPGVRFATLPRAPVDPGGGPAFRCLRVGQVGPAGLDWEVAFGRPGDWDCDGTVPTMAAASCDLGQRDEQVIDTALPDADGDGYPEAMVDAMCQPCLGSAGQRVVCDCGPTTPEDGRDFNYEEVDLCDGLDRNCDLLITAVGPASHTSPLCALGDAGCTKPGLLTCPSMGAAPACQNYAIGTDPCLDLGQCAAASTCTIPEPTVPAGVRRCTQTRPPTGLCPGGAGFLAAHTQLGDRCSVTLWNAAGPGPWQVGLRAAGQAGLTSVVDRSCVEIQLEVLQSPPVGAPPDVHVVVAVFEVRDAQGALQRVQTESLSLTTVDEPCLGAGLICP